MAAPASATQISGIFSSIITVQPNSLSVYKARIHMLQTTTSSKRISQFRASSKPQRERADSAEDKAAFISQEDLKYFVKLGAGSVAGAAAIKYGSVIFPEITRPNLALALFMISAPVVVAVFLLIRQSRLD